MPNLLIGHKPIKLVALGLRAPSWFQSAEVGELRTKGLGKGGRGHMVWNMTLLSVGATGFVFSPNRAM